MYLPELHHYAGTGWTKHKGVGKSKNKRLTGMLWQSQWWSAKKARPKTFHDPKPRALVSQWECFRPRSTNTNKCHQPNMQQGFQEYVVSRDARISTNLPCLWPLTIHSWALWPQSEPKAPVFQELSCQIWTDIQELSKWQINTTPFCIKHLWQEP